jgi:ParB-like chromosome segregation protein Spo0J
MPKSNLPSAQLKTIRLSQIVTTDDTFRITTRTGVDDLLASIPQVGILNPPLLIKKLSDFTIVSGFRRIAACNKLNRQEITVRVLEPGLGSLEYLLFAIADNASQRPLDLIETSRALYKLAAHLNTGNQLIEFASALGLPSNIAVIKKIKDLCRLPESIQSAILSNTVSLSMALDLKKWPLDCAVALVQLFDELKLSLNNQREIMTLVKEIARRDGISEQIVLEDRQLQDIIIDQDLDRNLKTREIRAFLKQRRFPRIANAEVNFEKQRKQLNLGSDIKLIPPKDFEGTTYTVNMSFNSTAQLKMLHTKLGGIIQNPTLKNMIERKDNSSE